jgi:hypothetical protein
MRHAARWLFIPLSAWLAASDVEAGALIHAEINFDVHGFPPATFTSSGLLGGSAHGTGAGATWSVAAGAVPSGTATPTLNTSAAPPIDGIYLIVNGNPVGGIFAASADGSMPVTGFLDITAYGGLTLLGIPLHAGESTIIQPPLATGVGVTVHANAWTTKTTSIDRTTMVGTGAESRMGSNGLVGGGGTVVLVSALNVLAAIAGQLPSFATLTLTYAPDVVAEPGALLGLGSAIAGLATLGRRRRGR